MSKEAMKLALEALEWMVANDDTNEGDEPLDRLGGQSWNEYNSYWLDGLNNARASITALREALAEQPAPVQQEPEAWAVYWGHTLARKHSVHFENETAKAVASEIKSFETEVRPLWSSPQPAQQEPVAWRCLIAEADFSEDTVTLAMQCTDYKVSAVTHWLYTSPPAQRTWVGLTDGDLAGCDEFEYKSACFWEAKLKEKNT